MLGQHFARSAHVCVVPPLEVVEPLVEPLDDEAVWQVTTGAQLAPHVWKPFSQSWQAWSGRPHAVKHPVSPHPHFCVHVM
jgi:hypothetical protein